MRAQLTFAVLAALIGWADAARAQSIALQHVATIYQDAKEAPLRAPEGVGCSDDGRLVIADTGNKRLVTYAVKNQTVTPVAEIKLTQLSSPVRVQLDAKGNTLALDSRTRRIVRVDPAGAFLGYVEVASGEEREPALAAAFRVDTGDNVHALDLSAGEVKVIDSAGAVTRRVPLPREKAVFTDVAVDLAGTIYVLDSVGAAVWAAERGDAAFKLLTKGLKEYMNFPIYVTADRGKLLLVDQHGNGVIALGQDGAYQGRQLAIGWSKGLVYYPAQLCVNRQGEAFLADRANNRVQIFTTAR